MIVAETNNYLPIFLLFSNNRILRGWGVVLVLVFAFFAFLVFVLLGTLLSRWKTISQPPLPQNVVLRLSLDQEDVYKEPYRLLLGSLLQVEGNFLFCFFSSSRWMNLLNGSLAVTWDAKNKDNSLKETGSLHPWWLQETSIPAFQSLAPDLFYVKKKKKKTFILFKSFVWGFDIL